MKGIYVLTCPKLMGDDIIKIGMSLNLTQRLYDIEKVFYNCKYLFCYNFLNHNTRDKVLWIEKEIFETTKFKWCECYQTEYRFFDYTKLKDLNKIICSILDKYEINYKIYENIKFDKKYNQKIEDEYDVTKIKYNPFLDTKRNDIQKLYFDSCIDELKMNHRVLLKAPTGFGKTYIFFQIINFLIPKICVIFTPRLLLNKQTQKYKNLLNKEYTFYDFSNSKDKLKLIDKIQNVKYLIIISCYQSSKRLYKCFSVNTKKINLVIFDEAHTFHNKDEEHINYWFKSENIQNRIFTTATPTENMTEKIFGKLIEKVKIADLINLEILCGIQTIIKKVDEFCHLGKFIKKIMIKYDKRKGIIYVNSQENAKSLYKLMAYITKTFIYISDKCELINKDDDKIEVFEKCIEKCVIITCRKIDYGYDNSDIDLICFGDPRQSDIDIRQIVGRGLRWNKNTYKNKLLHVVLPIYQDELEKKYAKIKEYLNFIISECDQDIILNSDGSFIIGKSNCTKINDYFGDLIDPIILKSLCTTGHNMFSNFMKFLKGNKIFNENSYNELYEKNKDWMCELSEIKKKYPKFCFKDLQINKNKFYLDKSECLKAYKLAHKKLIKKYDNETVDMMLPSKLIKKINKLDCKIPDVKLDLYY